MGRYYPMKVFISWSGPESEAIAKHLRDWLPNVIQSIEPYFTPADVEKGSRWSSEISHELSSSKIGILCVTKENINSPWLLFEAGALSKELEDTHVCPIIFGMEPSSLAQPMAQFQATKFEKADFLKLVGVINAQLGERKLQEKNLNAAFEKFWPDLEANIDSALASISDEGDTPKPSQEEMLTEILQIVRRPPRPSAISTKAATGLLHGYIALHDGQAKRREGYQETLASLRELHEPLEYIIRRHAPQVARTPLMEQFDNLSYREEKPDSVDDDQRSFDDDIPF